MTWIFPISEQTQADYWQRCERLLPHVLICISLHELWNENDMHYLPLMNYVATYLSNRAQYNEAALLFEQVQRIGEKALDIEHPLVGDALYGLAMLARIQGKYAEAEWLYQRILHIREHTLGPEHSQLAEALQHVGYSLLTTR